MSQKISTIEITDCVKRINKEISDCLGTNSGYYKLILTGDGLENTITFMGVTLWMSTRDNRQYYDAKDEYESLYDCLVRNLFIIIKIANKISLPIQATLAKNGAFITYAGYSIKVNDESYINQIINILNQVSYDELLVEDTNQREPVVVGKNGALDLKLEIKSLSSVNPGMIRFQNGLIVLLNRIL